MPRVWRSSLSNNFHVAGDLRKIDQGIALSPVLLVRGDLGADYPLVIADGYHRICASYHVDENAAHPCHLVDHKGDQSPIPTGKACGAVRRLKRCVDRPVA